MTVNSTLNRYRSKVKGRLEKKTMKRTLFLFSYSLALFQEAIESRGDQLKKYKICKLLRSLYHLQQLTTKKKQLFAPYIEMSPSISYWVNTGQEDDTYIHELNNKLQSKLTEPACHEEWKHFYNILKEMIEYTGRDTHISSDQESKISNEHLSNAWMSLVQVSDTKLPKPWLSNKDVIPNKNRNI